MRQFETGVRLRQICSLNLRRSTVFEQSNVYMPKTLLCFIWLSGTAALMRACAGCNNSTWNISIIPFWYSRRLSKGVDWATEPINSGNQGGISRVFEFIGYSLILHWIHLLAKFQKFYYVDTLTALFRGIARLSYLYLM